VTPDPANHLERTASRLRDLRLHAYRPRTDRTPERFRFPAVDAHDHLGRWLTEDWAAPDVGALLGMMDELHVRAIVNLDGRGERELGANLARYDEAHPGRFATFTQPDWREAAEPGFGERLAATLTEHVRIGAKGLKVWKDLGLHVRDPRGELLLPDDERLDALWGAAAGLEIPVTIHTADPLAFFQVVDERNERLEELFAHPDWSFADRRRFPPAEVLVASLERLVARHPGTTFILAHAGIAEDLGWIDRVLTAWANVAIDIAARIGELGRRPRAFRDLVIRHADRVLLGTDEFPPAMTTYRTYARFLETADEGFVYAPEEPVPPQGRWTIGGLDLPEDVLRKVEGDNARRLIPGLDG
jgi:predicted TIM-barrel fold metal-dependent hydrolase